MKLKYSRTLVAALLAGIALSASASDPDVYADSARSLPCRL